MTTTRKNPETDKVADELASDAANLKGIIDAGSIVHARLRELSTGDVVDLAMDSAFLCRSSRPCHIIDALKELEDHGLVHRSETVSRGDSSEYLLTWSAGEIEPTELYGDRRGHAGLQGPEACPARRDPVRSTGGSRTGRSRTTTTRPYRHSGARGTVVWGWASPHLERGHSCSLELRFVMAEG